MKEIINPLCECNHLCTMHGDDLACDVYNCKCKRYKEKKLPSKKEALKMLRSEKK